MARPKVEEPLRSIAEKNGALITFENGEETVDYMFKKGIDARGPLTGNPLKDVKVPWGKALLDKALIDELREQLEVERAFASDLLSVMRTISLMSGMDGINPIRKLAKEAVAMYSARISKHE